MFTCLKKRTCDVYVMTTSKRSLRKTFIVFVCTHATTFSSACYPFTCFCAWLVRLSILPLRLQFHGLVAIRPSESSGWKCQRREERERKRRVWKLFPPGRLLLLPTPPHPSSFHLLLLSSPEKSRWLGFYNRDDWSTRGLPAKNTTRNTKQPCKRR